MATDYVVRLQGLDNLSGTINRVRQSLNDVGTATSKIDLIRLKFQKIESSTAPLKKKLRDVKFQMEQLAATGDTSSDLFKEMAKSAQQYLAALDKVNSSIRNVNNSSSQMNSGMSGFDVKGIAGDIASKSGLGNIGGMLGAIATPAGAATAAVAAVGTVMVKAGKAAADFETHLDSLQSLTGLDNASMKAISDGAVEMSKQFRSSAGEIVDAMKLIGSQAPELLKDKDALMEVTKAANVLSEAALIEVVDAAKGITIVMNQMGVSASEATNIINVLAASSQQGSADVAYLNKAFEKAGTAAKSAGMSYTELAAMVETVAPKFSSADVAGSQLSSTLLKLSMQSNDEFKPAVVGMSLALANLAAAEMNDAEMKNLVGESNVTMLKSLIEGKSVFDGYSKSLAGTNTAYEQMAINNDNLDGALSKLSSAWDAFLITLGQSAPMQGCIDNIMALMELLMEIVNIISDVIGAFDQFGVAADDVNIANHLIKLLTEVVKGVGVALQIVIALAAKVFNEIKEAAINAANGIKDKWNELTGVLSDNAFVQNISRAWTTIYNKAVEIIGKLKKMWSEFMQWLGLESKSTSTPAPMKDNAAKGNSSSTSSSTTSAASTGSKSGSKSSSGSKITYDKGSIAEAEAELQKLQNLLKNTNASNLEKISAIQSKIKEQQKKVDGLKLVMDFDLETDYSNLSLSDLEKEIKKVDDVLKSNVLTAEQRKQFEINKELLIECKANLDNNTIAGLDKQISEIDKKLKTDIITPEEKEQLILKKNMLVQVRAELSGDFNENTIKGLDNKIASLENKLKVEDLTLTQRVEIRQEITELQEKKEQKEVESGIKTKAKEGSIAYVLQQISDKQAQLKLEVVGSDEYNLLARDIAALTDLEHQIQIDINNDGIKSQLELAQEALDEFNTRMEATQGVVANMGNIFGSLGSAIGGTAGLILELSGQTATAVSQMIPLIVALMGAKQGEALASGTASAAALPFPANIAAIASIVATITSLFAGFAGSFADGGIIGGGSLHGDRLLARVNSGEMILNQKQQGNLFNALDNGNTGGGMLNVKFEISGSTLKGVLRNYESKMSKIK